ncbi:hypothetical protein L3X38_024993 [Prunus dulcis]|uniref:Uncharacterized protein n=1 Tax=Prunus dulcis TaxID=3755 RepID=A0AAD4W0T9_PRUDU|nr:hypothetical protein L3X38_024993 [Prunus dulcis]
MCHFLVDKLNPVESSIVLHGKTLNISVDDFVPIMGVKDVGEEVDFTGSMDDQHIVKVRNSFLGGKKLLKNNELKQIIVGTEETGDFFKVGFVMFALCTLLCPTTSVYVNLKYPFPLRDSKAIARKNWASYSFIFLLDSVRSFKENNQVYIGGYLLFLQLFYLDAIAHGSVLVDRSMLPLTVWGKVETEKNEEVATKKRWGLKVIREDDNMFHMGCDGGQEDLGNTKPPKSRPHNEDGTPNEQDDNVKGYATIDKTSAPSVEVIHERKHAKQPQNEDKMGHNDVKSLFLENCSSTSTRDSIVTRATANRKSGPHKRTHFEDINALKAKANVKTRQVIAHERIMKRLNVGPFWMSNDISEDDRDLLNFAFCCNPLDPKAWSELLVDTGAIAIDRHHFGSLAPGSPLFDDVRTMN